MNLFLPSSKIRLITAALCVVVSFTIITYATMTPQPAYASANSSCLICGELGGVDFLLNVLLFAPLGASLCIAGVRPFVALISMCGLTIVIELLQIAVIPGRDANIGDAIANGIGGIAGVLVCQSWCSIVWPTRAAATALLGTALAVWIVVQTTVAFSFLPFPPAEVPYYGQIGRSSGRGRTAYPGQVVALNIGREPVARWLLPNSRALYDILKDSVIALSASLRIGPLPHARAEIARITDGQRREVLSLEQDDGRLLFRVRTGAGVLRMRPYVFQLRDLLIAPPIGDTVSATLTFATSAVTMEGHRGGRVYRSAYVPRLWDGWRLISPVQTFVARRWKDFLLSVIFISILVMPMGYWLGSLHRLLTRPLLASLATGMSLAAGLSLIPFAFGLRPASFFEWLTATAALLTGFAGQHVVAIRKRHTTLPAAGCSD